MLTSFNQPRLFSKFEITWTFQTDKKTYDQLIYRRQTTSFKMIKANFVIYLQNTSNTLEVI